MSEEPKIVVDDDWKSQVEKEKDQLEQAKSNSEDESAPMDMPPASFTMLVTTLAMQASVALGQLADPATGQAQINKPVAKHFIDTLALLEDKTKGNLEKEESELLTSTVHQLRIAFITMPDTMPEPDGKDDGESKSKIELP